MVTCIRPLVWMATIGCIRLHSGFLEAKTKESWTWFMEQLRKAIREPDPLVVCNDACKGLTAAIQAVFSNAEKRECF